jgi:hypothetical protein
MKPVRTILIFLAIIFFVAACSPSQAEILGRTAISLTSVASAWTNTPVPTIVPSSTQTPSVTPTVTITPTLTPSVTPTPTIEPPQQLANVLEDVRITAFDGFDYFDTDPNTSKWNTQACETVNNGELVYDCTKGWLARNYDFHEGEGVLLDFKHNKQTDKYYWGINFSGNFDQDNRKTFGISDNSETGQDIVLANGDTWLGGNARWVKADIWYRLLLAVDKNGRIMILVWERDKPNSQPWKYTNTLGKDWTGLKWFFWVNNDFSKVTLYFDNFSQVAFSKFKN